MAHNPHIDVETASSVPGSSNDDTHQHEQPLAGQPDSSGGVETPDFSSLSELLSQFLAHSMMAHQQQQQQSAVADEEQQQMDTDGDESPPTLAVRKNGLVEDGDAQIAPEIGAFLNVLNFLANGQQPSSLQPPAAEVNQQHPHFSPTKRRKTPKSSSFTSKKQRQSTAMISAEGVVNGNDFATHHHFNSINNCSSSAMMNSMLVDHRRQQLHTNNGVDQKRSASKNIKNFNQPQQFFCPDEFRQHELGGTSPDSGLPSNSAAEDVEQQNQQQQKLTETFLSLLASSCLSGAGESGIGNNDSGIGLCGVGEGEQQHQNVAQHYVQHQQQFNLPPNSTQIPSEELTAAWLISQMSQMEKEPDEIFADYSTQMHSVVGSGGLEKPLFDDSAIGGGGGMLSFDEALTPSPTKASPLQTKSSRPHSPGWQIGDFSMSSLENKAPPPPANRRHQQKQRKSKREQQLQKQTPEQLPLVPTKDDFTPLARTNEECSSSMQQANFMTQLALAMAISGSSSAAAGGLLQTLPLDAAEQQQLFDATGNCLLNAPTMNLLFWLQQQQQKQSSPHAASAAPQHQQQQQQQQQQPLNDFVQRFLSLSVLPAATAQSNKNNNCFLPASATTTQQSQHNNNNNQQQTTTETSASAQQQLEQLPPQPQQPLNDGNNNNNYPLMFDVQQLAAFHQFELQHRGATKDALAIHQNQNLQFESSFQHTNSMAAADNFASGPKGYHHFQQHDLEGAETVLDMSVKQRKRRVGMAKALSATNNSANINNNGAAAAFQSLHASSITVANLLKGICPNGGLQPALNNSGVSMVASSEASLEELSELEEFANLFKKQRIKHGFTQGDVGVAIGKRYGTDFSQTTISRFEALNLSYKNMCKLRPLLKEWLEETDQLIAAGATVTEILGGASYGERFVVHRSEDTSGGQQQIDGTSGGGLSSDERPTVTPPIPFKKRRKRTNLDNAQKLSLDAYFRLDPRPDNLTLIKIANLLDLDHDVVRVWFCNRRQKLRKVED